MSTGDSMGLLYHEIAHTKDRYNLWRLSKPGNGDPTKWCNLAEQGVAELVGEYAARSPMEFIAEVYAALMTGQTFEQDVMELYAKESGYSKFFKLG
jgi:hypothetical protein